MDKLAIDNGKVIYQEPWAPWPYFAEDEIVAASDVLRSGKVNYWTGDIHVLENGQKVRGETGLFEQEFCDYLGAQYAITLANGSLALELALHSLGIGNGDEIIVGNRTFIASASACAMRGAVPVFADVDQASQNITLETIKQVFTPKTRAIICVHLGGWACEMDKIMAFAKEYDLKVIEDCAQSLGGAYKGKMLGTFADVSTFSFCQDKIITTGGEGGMLVTNNPNIYRKAWAYKDHGKDFDRYNQQLSHPLAQDVNNSCSYYTSLGTNWRMTEMQAAIGRLQLKKLPRWLKKRCKYANILNQGLRDVPGIKIIIPPEYITHAYYKYYCFIETGHLKENWSREQIIKAINAEGIVCQSGSTWGIGNEQGWQEVVCHISGRKSCLKLNGFLPNDYLLGTTALMFQVHPTLPQMAIEKTALAVKKVMQEAIK